MWSPSARRPAVRDDACAGRRTRSRALRRPRPPVVVSLDPLECVVAAVVVRSELHRSRARGLEPEHDDVVRGAREDLAPETCSAELVLHRRDPFVEVERAPVADAQLLVMAAEQQRHVAEHLVARLTVRIPNIASSASVCASSTFPSISSRRTFGSAVNAAAIVAIVRPACPDASPR